ncbi:MAG: helix-turn-helix domain-containing protein [Terriglobales bacterium]
MSRNPSGPDASRHKPAQVPPSQLTVTVPAVASALSVDDRTVWRLIAAGQLPTIRIGRRRLVPWRAVEGLARRGTPVVGAEAAR